MFFVSSASSSLFRVRTDIISHDVMGLFFMLFMAFREYTFRNLVFLGIYFFDGYITSTERIEHSFGSL